MQAKQKAELPSTFVEQREFQRNAINLSGDLIVPAEKLALPCRVLNLSGSGAGVSCEAPPPLHTYVILCLDGFGRLEGVTKWFAADELGLQFVFKEARRQRLLQDICIYANDGVAGETHRRRHARLPSISKVRFTLQNGDELHCEVIDASMRGLSLRTAICPPINALISVGRKYGRVVRHHSEGIAIEFSETEDAPIHGN